MKIDIPSDLLTPCPNVGNLRLSLRVDLHYNGVPCKPVQTSVKTNSLDRLTMTVDLLPSLVPTAIYKRLRVLSGVVY